MADHVEKIHNEIFMAIKQCGVGFSIIIGKRVVAKVGRGRGSSWNRVAGKDWQEKCTINGSQRSCLEKITIRDMTFSVVP